VLALIATNESLGSAPGDRHFADDGELVTPVVLDCTDPHCDVCNRAWFGLTSHGDTTTAVVVDRPDVTVAELRRSIHEWLDCRGTIDLIVQATEAGEYEVDGVPMADAVIAVDDLIDEHVATIRMICAAFGEGAVLSRLGDLVSERVMPFAA
jgi:hypothetical protein